MAMSILVTGGTGFIGQYLVPNLIRKGYKVTVWSRQTGSSRLPPWPVEWVKNLDQISPHKYSTVINLAGQPLASGRWSERFKRQLIASRAGVTDQLYDWYTQNSASPKVVISGSAIGYYGPHDNEPLSEGGTPTDSFCHRLCEQWEASAQRFTELGARLVILRLGVVLGRDGGVLPEMTKSLLFKVATQFGDGEAYFSWVHIDDVVNAIQFVLEEPSCQNLSGPLNITAPQAVPYKYLTEELKTLGHAWVRLPLPASLLRATMGQMANELLLTGQNVYPKKLLENGFSFRYTKLHDALEDCMPA